MIKFLPFFVFFYSCSSYVEYLEKNDEIEILKEKEFSQSCTTINSFNIVYEDEDVISTFQGILKSLPKNLSFSDKVVLFSLYQMSIRPDASGPNSRLQINFGNKTNWSYFDSQDLFIAKNDHPFLNGLKTYLKKTKNQRSLNNLLGLAHTYFPKSVPVTKSLNAFIQKYQGPLKNNPKSKRLFFKVNTPLQNGESLKTVNYNQFRNISKNLNVNGPLFNYPIKDMNNIEISSNVDLNLYSKKIFLIDRNKNKTFNKFAAYDDKGNFFISVSHQIIQKPGELTFNFFPKALNPLRPYPFLFIKKQGKNPFLQTFLATRERDPGQHLFHLLNYEIYKTDNYEDVKSYLGFPRYQFLDNPLRILYESKRGTKTQLDYFLGQNFPIYHIDQLGEIWSHTYFEKENTPKLITDPRFKVFQTCQKN